MKSSTMKTILKALHILLLVTVSVASQAAVESNTYILTDHLGSPILATDENGDTLWREDYQPYGTQLTNEDGDNSVGFTGHKDDKALGVTYMQGRWYHQGMGRFLAIDPVGFVENNPASFNRYVYANSNPYLYVDPDGSQSVPFNIGPYLRSEYRKGEMLAWQMLGRLYIEEGATAILGGAAGKVVGKAISAGIKPSSAILRSARNGFRSSSDSQFSAKFDKLNLGDSVIRKSHHNWSKLFGNTTPTLKDITPIVMEALKKGQWKTTGRILGKGKKHLGDKIELVQEVNGYNIWVGGLRQTDGTIIVNNAAVK